MTFSSKYVNCHPECWSVPLIPGHLLNIWPVIYSRTPARRPVMHMQGYLLHLPGHLLYIFHDTCQTPAIAICLEVSYRHARTHARVPAIYIWHLSASYMPKTCHSHMQGHLLYICQDTCQDTWHICARALAIYMLGHLQYIYMLGHFCICQDTCYI